jgi:hypothetical protein
MTRFGHASTHTCGFAKARRDHRTHGRVNCQHHRLCHSLSDACWCHSSNSGSRGKPKLSEQRLATCVRMHTHNQLHDRPGWRALLSVGQAHALCTMTHHCGLHVASAWYVGPTGTVGVTRGLRTEPSANASALPLTAGYAPPVMPPARAHTHTHTRVCGLLRSLRGRPLPTPPRGNVTRTC